MYVTEIKTGCGIMSAGFKSLHVEFHEKQLGFKKNTHDCEGPCVIQPVQEVSPVAFTPFLVFMVLHVNQLEWEESVWFGRQADTPPAPQTGLNQP